MAAETPTPSDRLLRAMTGFAIVPFCGIAAWLGLGPDAASWLVVGFVGVLLLGAFSGLSLAHANVGVVAALTSFLAGAAVIGIAARHASLPGTGPTIPPLYQAVAVDIDAQVPIGPELRCDPVLRGGRVIGAGRHPRIDAEGQWIWFQAPGPQGRIQIHRVPSGGGKSDCWTCDEAGNNAHPSLDVTGLRLLFETDRHGGADIHAMDTDVDQGRRPISRRLSGEDSVDRWPIHDPAGRALVWSRASQGQVAVQVASIVTGQGGLLLGAPQALFAGGTEWVAPLAWSPNARHLVVGRGSGAGVLRTHLIDPATGSEQLLGRVPGPGTVSFSRDGQNMAIVRTEAGLASPSTFGFLSSRRFVRLESPDAVEAALWIGAPGDEPDRQDLGRTGEVGPLTGVALAPDARSLVVSQWVDGADRLLRFERSCTEVPVPR